MNRKIIYPRSLLRVTLALSILSFPLVTNADQNRSRPTVTQLFSVETVKVVKKKTAKSRVYFGYVIAEESRVFDITPRYGGFVEKLYADSRFLKVKKGEQLLQAYSPEVQQAKEEYLNTLSFDERRSSPAMLKSARTKLELLGVPKSEIAAVKNRRKVSGLTMIPALESGWIFKKSIHAGSAFNSGQKLFEIVDLDKVWIEAKIYQQDIPLLETLTHFRVKATGAQKSFDARKLLLYPSLDPKEATATLRLEIDNPNGILKPGMYVRIESSASAIERVVIPRTAALRKNGKWYAFVASEYEGEYEPVEIDLKPIDRHYYQVLSGLEVGDEVVNNALFMMDSDAQINGLY